MAKDDIDYSDIPATTEEFWKDARVIVKVCEKHGELTREQVYVRREGYTECKACTNECARLWYKKNKERANERHRRWHEKNKNKVLESKIRRNKKSADDISDCYVKKIISGELNVKRSDITPEMIESRRLSIKATRLYRKAMRESKE